MRAKITIAFLSISLLVSLGLASNQAFAGGFCGDGQNNSDEECDDGANNGTTDCGCASDCTFPLDGITCGPPETDNECSNQNTCSGAGVCLARNVAEGVDCDLNACTDDECDGFGTCEEGPPLTIPECSRVGGELIPIETTSLILAGTQSTFSWMIPITVSAIGIAIVVARKFSKYQPD